jgi:hypothetical protein
MQLVDEGFAVSYLALEGHVPVYASDGAQVGTVDHVVSAPEKDIFHGIVMKADGGRRFVAADQIKSLHEHGVDLAIDSAAAAELPEPHGGAPIYHDREPGLKETRWQHILDRFTPTGSFKRDWSEDDR